MRCGVLARKASVVTVDTLSDAAKIVFESRASLYSDWTGDGYTCVVRADEIYRELFCAN